MAVDGLLALLSVVRVVMVLVEVAVALDIQTVLLEMVVMVL